MVKIYTKTGDDGTTGIIGGSRVKKNDPLMEAIGTVDELNAHMGILFEDFKLNKKSDQDDRGELLKKIQNNLFTLGSELADPHKKYIQTSISEASVMHLEQKIDSIEEELPELKNFILPAGTAWAAKAHLARAVCRRAERRLVELNEASQLSPTILKYINRLSDLLFVLARYDVALNNGQEIIWQART